MGIGIALMLIGAILIVAGLIDRFHIEINDESIKIYRRVDIEGAERIQIETEPEMVERTIRERESNVES